MSYNERYQQVLSNLTDLAQSQSATNIRLRYFNQSQTNANAEISNLQALFENLLTNQDDLELSLTRHSMELRGLSSTMRVSYAFFNSRLDVVLLEIVENDQFIADR